MTKHPGPLLGLFLLAVAAGIGAQESSQVLAGRISLKNKSWGLLLELPGFQVKASETRLDGRRYMMAENSATGVIVSVFLEEVFPEIRAQSCRENLEKRAKDKQFERKDVKISVSGDRTTLEYMIPKVMDRPVRQKNLFVCMFRDNVFIDLHLSKASFQPGEEKLFQAILDQVSFQEDIERTSLDYMEVASLRYLQKNFKMAIPAYAKALALEKENPSLNKNLWHVLIDNLGMAYGITGDLKNAKETFEYGLSKDSTYPLFYYNLACTYAETNDLEMAMSSLKTAFAYRANVIPGEKMPDPRKDDSFRRFLKNDRFKSFLDLQEATEPVAQEVVPGASVPADSSGPGIGGTLTDLNGPIADAMIILQSLRDHKCVKVFTGRSDSEKDRKYIASCAVDVAQTQPDNEGRFRFANIRPGWYALRFLWDIHVKPSAPQAFERSGFAIMFTGRKDTTGKYDTLAQGQPVYFPGKVGLRLDFDFRKP